jgi:hypothetical protein
MAKTTSDYIRYESGDPAELADELAAAVRRLGKAGIHPDTIIYKPEFHYFEVHFEMTAEQARALGCDAAYIEQHFGR